MLFFPKRYFPCAAPILMLTLAGCGGSGLVQVSGTLTYKGQPVTNAFLDFVPENGRPSLGETDDQGRFKLVYAPKQDGAERGKHKVSVRPKQTATQIEPGKTAPVSRDMQAFFDKYSYEKSKVEVTIDKSKSDLKLDWD
jgi:hypothetical protein